MLQLKNNTPFAATMALFPDPQGVDTLYIFVKAGFNLGPQWTLQEEQAAPLVEDIYWGEPGKSSIRYASDFHTGKPATDIVINGHAYAGASAVRMMDIAVSVGGVGQQIRVFGDRLWDGNRITSAEPFQSMPIVYEKAYGGTQVQDDRIVAYEPRNPIGLGFIGNPDDKVAQGVALPNLENPAQLIQQLSDRPAPVGLGCIAPHWEPRASRAGSYDEQWQTSRAPYLPKDFNPAFLNMAHPSLVYPGYLEGHEHVAIEGMHPEGPLQFTLPQVKLVSQVFVRNRVENPPFKMETLLIEPDHMGLSMVWKAEMRCDKESLKIRAVNINLSR